MTDLEIEQLAANHMMKWARGVFGETQLDTLNHTDRVLVEALIESADITIEWDRIDD